MDNFKKVIYSDPDGKERVLSEEEIKDIKLSEDRTHCIFDNKDYWLSITIGDDILDILIFSNINKHKLVINRIL